MPKTTVDYDKYLSGEQRFALEVAMSQLQDEQPQYFEQDTDIKLQSFYKLLTIKGKETYIDGLFTPPTDSKRATAEIFGSGGKVTNNPYAVKTFVLHELQHGRSEKETPSGSSGSLKIRGSYELEQPLQFFKSRKLTTGDPKVAKLLDSAVKYGYPTVFDGRLSLEEFHATLIPMLDVKDAQARGRINDADNYPYTEATNKLLADDRETVLKLYDSARETGKVTVPDSPKRYIVEPIKLMDKILASIMGPTEVSGE